MIFPLQFYSLSGLINFITSTILGILLLFVPGSARLRIVFACLCFAVSFWSLFVFLWLSAKTLPMAEFYLRTCMYGVCFLPVLFMHFIVELTNFKLSRRNFYLHYGITFFFCFFVYSKFFANSPAPFLVFPLWLRASTLLHLFILYFTITVVFSILLLWKSFRKSEGILKTRLLYVFISAWVGFIPGAMVFGGWYRIAVPPFPLGLISVYVLLIFYAIIRYRLMDIRLAISNTAIFIAVYTIVLGVPFFFGYKYHSWQISTWTMLVLATAGPFIYLYIQKRAEDRLLQEQRRYQTTLRQASAGMGKIKDLKKLLDMIVDVLTNAIQIEHALIYIYDGSQKQYVLGASKKKSGQSHFIHSIEEKSPLVQYLSNNKDSVIFEEVKQRSQDYKDLELTQIAQIISSLEGDLVVPIFIDQNLIAIIVMGKKESGKIYTEDDLAVFSILANQTALAIENAKFYEEMKLTNEQLFQAEKMATIGTMADGLSHQINNRFHALGFIAGDALDTIRLNQNELTPDKMKEVMTELERAFVRMQDNVVQGGEIVQGLLKYTRKGEVGFTAVDVQAVFKSALEMAQFKIKTDQLKIIHDYDPASIPKIKANFTQLQEVFFNLIDNGYDAMMQRKNEAKEPDYQPTLIVRVLKEDGYAQIIFEDNGMGVKEEDVRKLFTPFFTTKLSSKKGTGLGLYVIKKIVEDYHSGTVEMVSKYMQGTQMKLRLPIAIG